jgi:hypothetical protein
VLKIENHSSNGKIDLRRVSTDDWNFQIPQVDLNANDKYDLFL